MSEERAKKTPRLARFLLRQIISAEIYDEVSGDFDEVFQDRLQKKGRVYAQFTYWLDVFDALRNVRLKRARAIKKTISPMFVHFFKLSLRNLRRNRGHAYLNLFGLLIGAISSVIILQYVFLERSFDEFHENKAEIYRLQLDFVAGDRVRSYGTSYDPLSQYIARDFPEVIAGGRLAGAYSGSIYKAVGVGGNPAPFKEAHAYNADQGFWDMFSFELINGNAKELLKQPNTIALSEATAIKYFGNTDVVGKFIQVNADDLYKVTGVFENIPENSHLKMDLILSLPDVRIQEFTWISWDTYNYIQLRPGAATEQLSSALVTYIDQFRKSPNYDMQLILQPLLTLHFDRGTSEDSSVKGDKSAVDTLYIMAIIIMLIAWVNFVNLYSAAALGRGKEVAMRKVMGSGRSQLLVQCLFESFLIHLITWTLAIGLVYFLTPLLGDMLGLPLPGLVFGPEMFTHLFSFLFIGGTLSGLYPAIILGSFRIKNVIHGRNAISSKGTALRKMLVVIQYAASIALVIITLVVFKQIDFMRNVDSGVRTDQTIVIDNPSLRDSTIFRKLKTMKSQLLNTPGINAVAYGQDVPGSPLTYSFGGVRQVSETVGNQFKVTTIEPDYADFFGLEFIGGRNVSENIVSDIGKVYINESAMKLLGFNTPEEALNKELSFPRENVWITGVVKDFHIASVKEEMDPTIFQYRPEHWPFGLDRLCVRVNTPNMVEILPEIQSVYLSNFPGEVFDYFFLDEHMQQQYEADITFGRLFGLFTILTIFIASLGLFGLISFTIMRKLKEMSIRKVLGAQVSQIVLLFSKDFLILLSIAAVLGAPLSYYFLSDWLNEFALRLSWEWYFIVLPIISVLLLTTFLIVGQTLSAARKNPSRYLRME